jgi:hypothetical protein
MKIRRINLINPTCGSIFHCNPSFDPFLHSMDFKGYFTVGRSVKITAVCLKISGNSLAGVFALRNVYKCACFLSAKVGSYSVLD